MKRKHVFHHPPDIKRPRHKPAAKLVPKGDNFAANRSKRKHHYAAKLKREKAATQGAHAVVRRIRNESIDVHASCHSTSSSPNEWKSVLAVDIAANHEPTDAPT